MSKMKKFIITLLLATVTAFGVAGCNAGTNELQDKIDSLQSQIEEVNDRLAKLDKLTDRLDEMEEEIDKLQKELAEHSQVKNTLAPPFYTLQTAYDNGWLSEENLQSIASYHHNNDTKYPESLSEETTQSIKKDWAQKLMNDKPDSTKNLTEDDVYIRQYYGTYNGCVAVILERWGTEYIQIYAPYTIEIGGVTFNYNYPLPTIVIWKK